jgi:hypothetical protein
LSAAALERNTAAVLMEVLHWQKLVEFLIQWYNFFTDIFLFIFIYCINRKEK